MKTIHILVLVLALTAIGSAKKLKASKILVALNCGLKEGFTKADG